MNQIFSTLIFIFGFSLWANAQSFSTQVLNKGIIESINVKLQDYDGDGDLDIIAAQRDPDALIWLENEPTKQFPKRTIISQNITRIGDVDIADFDLDGDMDYLICMQATVGVSTDGELAWFQRQSDGTYIKWTVDSNWDFVSAEVADLNGDGQKDIIASGIFNNGLFMYLNQGNLFFTEIPLITNDNFLRYPMNANDIDNDGDIDIVIGGSGLAQDNTGARMLRNDGNANFTVGAWLHCWGDSYNDCGGFEKIIIEDLNSDGIKDILAFTGTGLASLYWLDGSNGYNQTSIDQDDMPADIGGDILVFDVNQDGRMDIVRTNKGKDIVSVLYQTANLVFQRQYVQLNWLHGGGNPTTEMAKGDIDGDGDIDVILPDNNHDITWLENINGEFFAHAIYNRLIGAGIPKFADFDQDGDLDIFVTGAVELVNNKENEVSIYENLGSNNFFNWRLHDDVDYAADIEPADIDGDGDLDVFVTAKDATDLIWLKNNGKKGNWEKTTIDNNANESFGIRAFDLDLDNDKDLVLCSNNDDKLFWYQNNGSGTFSKLVIDPNIDAPREVEAADLDGDGDIDLTVSCSSTANTVAIYINNGAQSFTRQVLFTGKTAFDIEIADWNNDGKPDIVFTLSATSPVNPQQEVVALINNGGNTFTTTPLVVNAEKGTGLKVADLDNDGDMDFVVGRSVQVRARMWLQTPNGLLGSTLSDVGAVGSTPQVLGLDVADTNGDGKNEIVFADFARDELVLISFNCFSGATLTTSIINAACGQANGSITVIPTGGTDLSYLWNNGSTTATADSLAPGTYTVTVTANGGCTSTASATISAQQVVTVSTSKTNATCGNANGTATVNSQNGIDLASFLWSNGATTQTATGLAAGTYTVTATDINGCMVTSSATINATPVATLTLTPTNTTCGNNDGKVTVSISGGSPISSYLWSNGATTQNLLNIPGGAYAVTATDGDGCQIIGSATVTGLTNPTVNLGADISFQQGQQAVLDATGTGLTYLWSTGATTPTITVTLMGTYSVTVTNDSGCTATDEIVVTVTTSTIDQDNKYKITVSPNPAHDIIYIRCEGGSTYLIELIDIMGQLLLKDNSFAPDGAIRNMKVDEIPTGTYHLKVSGKDFSRTILIVKN